MAYDEFLADRIRRQLNDLRTPFTEKKMMGGLCFMVDDKMCMGIVKNNMMARIDPAIYDQSLLHQGVKPMDFTGRPMKGYVFIEPSAIDMDEELSQWIKKCLAFNPKAKSSKKR